MGWTVVVTGTVDLDDIVAPAGERTGLLGGSAVYSALAARRFVDDVRMVARVGADGLPALRRAAATAGIASSGVSVTDRPTRRWRAVHDVVTGATDELTLDAGDTAWRPRLSGSCARAEVLFAGSMEVAMQDAALQQSDAQLVGVDSMREFIDRDRSRVLALARRADILFATREELGALQDRDPSDWIGSARRLLTGGRLRAVVVKAGSAGAAVVTAGVVIERPARDATLVVDPTGAGDALAGGFIGSCARAGRADDAYFPVALADGIDSAAMAISSFGCEALLGATAATPDDARPPARDCPG